MKILSAAQTREIDTYTVKNEPVASIDLMERAAKACAMRIMELIRPTDEVFVFCGTGNNGGDGLAISRLLMQNNYKCKTLLIQFSPQFSPDAQVNYNRLKQQFPGTLTDIHNIKDLKTPGAEDPVAIDALLGTGVNTKAEGFLADCIDFINQHFRRVISVDVPSGMYPDGAQKGQKTVRSSLTLTFQYPKLAFLLPENAGTVPAFEVLDIGLSAEAIENTATQNFYVNGDDICSLLKRRNKFSHKGTYGHALLVAGSSGKSGAALIAAEAALRAGAGLLTVHSTAETLRALAVRLPEAMSSEDAHSEFVTSIEHPERFSALAFGPGAGLAEDTALVLKNILQHGVEKLVIDADGLNILSENKTWLEFLPPATILTPHPKEFERLTEKHGDDMDRLAALRQFSLRHNCIMVLKGAHTCIAMPDGNFFFNAAGNPGLAKGGSGDALTGVILGLLASGYNAPQSSLIGVYVHGLAADLCAAEMGEEAILATDVISRLPAAFKHLHQLKMN